MNYRVIKNYESPYLGHLIFRAGEVVEVGEEFTDDPDWKDWVWCESPDGVKAWTPKQFLNIEGESGTFVRDYDARELSISVGEQISIIEIVNGFGMAEKSDGAKGWVPLKCVERII